MNSITVLAGLRDRIAARVLHLRKKDIELVLATLADEMEKAFCRGQRVRFTKHFSLVPVKRKKRLSYNPATKKSSSVPAKVTLKLSLVPSFALRLATRGKACGGLRKAPPSALRKGEALQCLLSKDATVENVISKAGAKRVKKDTGLTKEQD
jgi:nucleoid DNA-binding protein